MKRSSDFAMSGFRFAVMALFPAFVIVPALAQQTYSGGIVDDWTHHHVIFSNPGTLEDSLKKGTYQEWRRIMADPRYQMQQARRYGPVVGRATLDTVPVPGAMHETNRFPRMPRPPNPPPHRWN